MNDQQNPYDPYYPQQPQIIGYDEYGRPVYQQPQHSQQPQGYDPYTQQPHQQQQQPPHQQQQHQQQQQAQQGQPQGYGYDPYAAQPQQPQGYDPYAQQGRRPHQTQPGYGYDGYDTGQQAAVDTTQQWSVPPQQPPAAPPPRAPQPPQAPRGGPERPTAVPGQRRPAPDEGDRDYRTEQFSFIEEQDEDSEDVIDWLKFTESRSERREEAKRRGRNRVVALFVVLVLVAVGSVGYLWYTGKLPGTGESGTERSTATGPQKRDMIVVHLHNTKQGGTSTALLVDNETTKQGTTVLLPNSLSVAGDEGTATTLGKSVDEDGSTGTREAIGSLLGTGITGTWRLDTPYLENLVELVGGIDIDTNAQIPAAKKGEPPLVKKGEKQTLNGRMAVAYATYRGPGEAEAEQLQRFGQVMYGVLRKISSDPQGATVTVETLAQILDPSLPEKDLGASLAKLSEYAKGGDYKTALLPVEQDGTLSQKASDSVVKDILGGKVSAPEQGAAVRVGVRNASGDADATEDARIVLVNGGYAFVDAGKAETASASQVLYGDAAQKAKAVEVAKTLGLPESAVEKGKAAANADVTVVLGTDYETKG